jgi:hypothetical protein
MKTPDLNEQHKQQRSACRDRASLFREEFPHLASLVIEMSFRPDWGSPPTPTQRCYGPTSKAFFEIECPDYECVAGGFDLSWPVSEIVNSGDLSSSGSLICQGWQGRERIGKHRCLLTMEYKIGVTYQDA